MNRLIPSILMLFLLLAGCGGEIENKKPTPDLDTIMNDGGKSDELFEEAKKIYYSMPSPLELTTLIKQAGGEFQKGLVLNTKGTSDYQSTLKQGMILGVYGADLSYTRVYEQQQESLLLLAAAKRLAGTIGIHDAFSNNRVERANNNLNNKDSMVSILSEVYWEINGQLKDENRNEIAMLVMVAGWVEGLYIGVTLADVSNPNDEIMKRLMEQKFTAMQIEDMFEEYSEDNMLAQSRPYFVDILNFYANLPVTEEPTEISEPEDGKFVIGGAKEVQYSAEDFNKLKELALESRTKIVAL